MHSKRNVRGKDSGVLFIITLSRDKSIVAQSGARVGNAQK